MAFFEPLYLIPSVGYLFQVRVEHKLKLVYVKYQVVNLKNSSLRPFLNPRLEVTD